MSDNAGDKQQVGGDIVGKDNGASLAQRLATEFRCRNKTKTFKATHFKQKQSAPTSFLSFMLAAS